VTLLINNAHTLECFFTMFSFTHLFILRQNQRLTSPVGICRYFRLQEDDIQDVGQESKAVAKRHAALILGTALSSGLFFDVMFPGLSAIDRANVEPKTVMVQALTSLPSCGS
jgi:hypothetical protein